MPSLLQALKRDGGQLTLALLDIDNFGRINDEASHLDGDRAIRHIGSFLKGMLEEEERIVRLGGQEFVLLLRCPVGSAWERIDRTRRALADLFQGDDYINMFKRREIYRHLSNAADRMANCANTLHDIVVKIC